jgi:hypothetical protein
MPPKNAGWPIQGAWQVKQCDNNMVGVVGGLSFCGGTNLVLEKFRQI